MILPKFDFGDYASYLEKENMKYNHIERTKRMIEVMQAYVDGEEIECSVKAFNGMTPHWNWEICDYRIAKTPDIINWDHVAPEFKYMARDQDGYSYLYNVKPHTDGKTWCVEDAKVTKPENYASYKRGNVDWKDSLVIRPGCE